MKLNQQFLVRVLVTFVVAFLGVFITGVSSIATNLVSNQDWNATKAALIALVAGAIAAGIKAVQALFVGVEPDEPHVKLFHRKT